MFLTWSLLVIRLSIIFSILMVLSSCDSWNQTDVKTLEELASEIRSSPSNTKLRERLVSGMESNQTLEAVNYIHYGGELLQSYLSRCFRSSLSQLNGNDKDKGRG
ncbi:MAG: hypothetical protein ACI9R3_003371 [Verrucomicrobiales bacterium]|jgi:hypothetical protein